MFGELWLCPCSGQRGSSARVCSRCCQGPLAVWLACALCCRCRRCKSQVATRNLQQRARARTQSPRMSDALRLKIVLGPQEANAKPASSFASGKVLTCKQVKQIALNETDEIQIPNPNQDKLPQLLSSCRLKLSHLSFISRNQPNLSTFLTRQTNRS